MPETPLNPFRDTPPDLNPKEDPFFQDFVPGYQPQEADQPAQPPQEAEPEPTNTELGPTATKEEIEAYDNQLVECARIEVTRKQERQINQIIANLNNDREKQGLEPVELGREITLHKVEIGGKSKAQLKHILGRQHVQVNENAQVLIDSRDFVVQEQKEQLVLIKLKVEDLGFSKNASIDEIYAKAISVGMELCPFEAAIQFRLQYKEPLLGERAIFGMKRIKDPVGREGYFSLYRTDDGTQLYGMFFESTEKLRSYNSFVFSL